MVLIQSSLSAGAANVPVIQGRSIANSLPVIAIQSSDSLPPSYASNNRQTAAATTTSTSKLLNALGVTTTKLDAAENAGTTLSAINPSVTAHAKITTAPSTLTLSDYIDLPIQQTKNGKIARQRRSADSSTLPSTQKTTVSEASVTKKGVESVAPCLNDYFIQHANETTTHRLVNICKEPTQIKGHIDPRCSVKPNSKNPLNEFKLEKQGDTYKVLTRNSDICQQPILINNHPKKIGSCLYVSETTNDDEFETQNLTVVNGCDGTKVQGFFAKKCKITKEKSFPWDRFTLTNLGDTFTYHAYEYCGARDVIEGQPPTANLVHAYLYSQVNTNGTISHELLGRASPSINGYLVKNCTLNEPSPDNEWNQFKLNADQNLRFLVHDKPACKNPFRFGKPPRTSYVPDYCSMNKSSAKGLPDMPKAEKIVGGAKLLFQNAKHLVHISMGNYSCTGSLISDRHVLTAGHCLHGHNEDDAKWRLDFLDDIWVKHDPYPEKRFLYEPQTKYKVKAAHIAPCYINERKPHCDLALLELEKTVENAQRISLPTQEDFCEFAHVVSQVLATDKGFPNELTGHYDKTQKVWQEGNVIVQGFGLQVGKNAKLVHSETAQHGKVVAFFIEDNSGFIVSDPSSIEKTSTCDGDSGGPLIFETKEGKKVQVGVTSRKIATVDLCRGTSYYTNVYAKEHREWIQARLNEDSDIVTIHPEDLTRLRYSPDSCVEKRDEPDGFFSWLAGFTSPTKSRRRLTFTNSCHHINHSPEVNIKFYIGEHKKENQKTVAGIETTEQTIRLNVGETRVFHTSGKHVRAVLTWHDSDTH